MVPQAIKEFGTVRENEERRDGGCAVVFEPTTGLFAVGKERESGRLRLFSGGVEHDEQMRDGILREVREESGLYDFGHIEFVAEALAHYHNRLKNVNRVAHAHCFLVVLKSTATQPTELEAHETFDLAWASASEIFTNWKSWNEDHGLDHWVYFFELSLERIAALGYVLDH
ncbi:MAG TPA: NUDIX domain-containing protein [Candidatus Paceibacterota bacterium]|nr:NUDIX domain-containing protein [Candidatus Paceibacterota bacterium]